MAWEKGCLVPQEGGAGHPCPSAQVVHVGLGVSRFSVERVQRLPRAHGTAGSKVLQLTGSGSVTAGLSAPRVKIRGRGGLADAAAVPRASRRQHHHTVGKQRQGCGSVEAVGSAGRGPGGGRLGRHGCSGHESESEQCDQVSSPLATRLAYDFRNTARPAGRRRREAGPSALILRAGPLR
jgi:hypothetical protein